MKDLYVRQISNTAQRSIAEKFGYNISLRAMNPPYLITWICSTPPE
jgi:hypothetical protein